MNSAPDYIQFYPTLRCNLSCDFCFNKGMPRSDDISLRDFKNISGKLAEVNVRAVDIMGGEPTLHRDIIPMLEYADLKGFHLNLSSNGADLEALQVIVKRFNRVNLGLSINETSTLKKLEGFIKTYKPATKTVLRNNTETELIDRILLLQPKKLYLLYLDIMSKELIENAMPFTLFLAIAQKLSILPLIGTVYCSGFIPDTANYPVLSKTRCPAGTTKLGLMPDGSVYPCNLFFGIEEFRLGNLLYDRFRDIWNHKKLDFFRRYKGNLCRKTMCIIHKICHGGCPAHSLIHSNDLCAPDPRCTLL